ncbi:PaaI family thioesterase [Hyphococcus lacteus]|uniref:PaaI family thioesterase n=1 Tax=Hyphococcus lacteus TaxID=3143536 RepID=A0ABV3Z8C2_9PROT
MTNEIKRICAFADASPVAKWLGFSAEIVGDDTLFILEFAEHHIGNAMIRALHGGAIATFLEFAANAKLFAHLGTDATISTVNADIEYLTSASAKNMTARVRFIRVGRRLAFVEATGWQANENTPVAVGRFRFKLGTSEK